MAHPPGRFAAHLLLLIAAGLMAAAFTALIPSSAAQTADTELRTLAIVVDRLVAVRWYAIQAPSRGGAAGRGAGAAAGVVPDIAVLQSALRSPDARVRRAALRGLGRLETPADVAVEAAFLADPDARVRGEAANAIAESLRSPEAPGFQDATGLAYRSLAVRALTETNGATAGLMFEALGQLRDASLSSDIERILVRGTHIARPAPRDFALRQEGALRGLEALIRRRARQTPIAAETRSRLRQLAVASLGFEDDVGPIIPAVQALATAGEDDVATILRVAGFQCAESPRTRILAAAARDDCGWEVRRLGLQMIPAPHAVFQSVLTRGLRDPSFHVRIEALKVYDREPAAVPSCATNLAALTDRSPVVVAAAMRFFKVGCVEASDVESRLQEAVRDSAEPTKAAVWQVPLTAFETLARFSPRLAGEFVRDSLVGHSVPQVRAAAVRVAVQLRDVDLVLLFARDAAPGVRAEVLVGLQHLGSDQLVAVAVDALARSREYRPSHQVIYAAGLVLRRSAHVPAVLPAIVRVLAELNQPGLSTPTNESSREARLALLDLIRESRPTDDVVIGMVRGMIQDSDPRVAVAAAETVTVLAGIEVMPAPAIRAPDLSTALSACVEIAVPQGTVTMRVLPDEAPVSVAAFLKLVDRGYYDGLTFHRAYASACLQGGSPDGSDYAGGETLIRDESGPAHHLRGTVGIVQRGRHAGNIQLFVNLVDAPHLDREFTVIGTIEPCRLGDRRSDLMMDTLDAVREGDRIVSIKRVITN